MTEVLDGMTEDRHFLVKLCLDNFYILSHRFFILSSLLGLTIILFSFPINSIEPRSHSDLLAQTG